MQDARLSGRVRICRNLRGPVTSTVTDMSSLTTSTSHLGGASADTKIRRQQRDLTLMNYMILCRHVYQCIRPVKLGAGTLGWFADCMLPNKQLGYQARAVEVAEDYTRPDPGCDKRVAHHTSHREQLYCHEDKRGRGKPRYIRGRLRIRLRRHEAALLVVSQQK